LPTATGRRPRKQERERDSGDREHTGWGSGPGGETDDGRDGKDAPSRDRERPAASDEDSEAGDHERGPDRDGAGDRGRERRGADDTDPREPAGRCDEESAPNERGSRGGDSESREAGSEVGVSHILIDDVKGKVRSGHWLKSDA
jgi:hypothetical protein